MRKRIGVVFVCLAAAGLAVFAVCERQAADVGEELAAEELRRAAFSFGRLLGRVDVEDILDVIFRDFCIGK